ncbi:MAG: FGGY-family carbohydrate kinase [Candidatus Baldrarchaeia archaeon]
MSVRSKAYLLGVDIGTSSSKGMFIDSNGKVIAESFVEHGINIIKPGWVEQDPEMCYWGDFKEIVRTLLRKSRIPPEDIKGIGISSLSPDIVPIDKNGDVIRPAIIYMDRRAWKECEELKNKFGEKEIVKVTGNAVDPYFAGYKLIWYMKNEPENYKKTWRVLNADKYVVFKLTGVPAIDRVNATLFAPYYDVINNSWSEKMSELIGGGIEKLPKIFESYKIVGYVTSDAAKETGLVEGIPVVASGPDAIVSAYSVGMISAGDSCFMYGTTGCWFVVVDKPVTDKRLISTYHVVPGKYIVGGGLIATGALVRWFRDNFGQMEKYIEEASDINAYQLLDKQAEKIAPGADGLIVLPYFMGERTPIWDVDAKGLIFGLTLSHTKAHLFRALLEASGYGLRHHIDIARSLGVNIREMLAVNGGAKSRLWRQIISDITGVPQLYVSPAPGAPFGDAFIAGIGTGIFKNFEEIKSYIHPKEKTEPNNKNYELYSKLYSIYLKLYPEIKEYYKELTKIVG